MDTIHGEGAIYINRSPDDVFGFLCDPDVDPARLTPMEDRITERQAPCEVRSISRLMIEFAARELDCRARWGERLATETLANMKSALEGTPR